MIDDIDGDTCRLTRLFEILDVYIDNIDEPKGTEALNVRYSIIAIIPEFVKMPDLDLHSVSQ